jgi:peptide/nickel transport system permease protein
MLSLIIKRLGIGLITVIAVSLIIFLGTKILPGDAAQIRLGQQATAENIAAFRTRLAINRLPSSFMTVMKIRFMCPA